MKVPEKYDYKKGTHCWFCNREFNTSKGIYVYCGLPLPKTKEHIVPLSKGGINNVSNYIASCRDCNTLKADKDAKQFALFLMDLLLYKSAGGHNMCRYFKIMITRSWKIYNKTSKLHKKYSRNKNY